MKRFAILISIICFLSCQSSRRRFNAEAIKLNDSAMSLQMKNYLMALNRYGGPDSVRKVQIALLTKAIEIDTSYFIAYWNKFNCQVQLKQYAGALITGKRLVILRPNDPVNEFLVGKVYDKLGDTIHAKAYYKNYLSYCSSILDTMATSNRQYRFVVEEKAIVLILLGQQQNGKAILKKLFDTEPISMNKPFDSLYMGLTRKDIIDGKDLRMTVDNTSYSINP